MVKLLLESGTLDLNKTDTVGNTLFHLAAEGGNKNVVQALLDAGADVSRENGDGDSALHLAADWGSIDVVEVLVNAKADVSNKNKAGMSARDVAARSNYRQITAIMDRSL
jgi:ankyrin repeat protein